jgi:hypothetical protein
VKVYANEQRKITCGEFSKMVRSFSRNTIFFSFSCTSYVLKMIGYLGSISS